VFVIFSKIESKGEPMAHFWLTPLISKDPLILGADRLKCLPLAELTLFRQAMDAVHPWLLPIFKANLLLNDGLDDNCGIDGEELTLSLAEAEDIVFDGSPYILSHCADNFLERLLKIEQSQRGLQEAGAANKKLWTKAQLLWLEFMSKWLDAQKEVILIREEEY
jgi:hypothetical protein